MNAVSLYVSTCRMVVQADANDVDSWSELSSLLPQLRQALSCSVCGKMLREPTSSADTLCQHSVCRSCIGGRMRIRPVCRCTKDYGNFVDNRQMRILLQCFRKFCQYLWSTPLCRKLETLRGNSSTNLSEIILEGIGVKEEFPTTGVSINNFLSGTNHLLAGEGDPAKPLVSNGTYSVMYAGDDTTKITIKRKPVESPSSSDSNDPDITFKKIKPGEVKTPSNNNNNNNNRRGCRCGLATQVPGKLTCCGQRCPCYVDGKECQDCKCRGCRNPCKETEQLNTSQTLITSSEGLSADDRNHTDTSSDLDVF